MGNKFNLIIRNGHRSANWRILAIFLIGSFLLLACGSSVKSETVQIIDVMEAASGLPYQDASLDIDLRVADLLSRMTLEEKLGQMTLIEKGSLRPSDVSDFFLGAVLSGGGGYPRGYNDPDGWLEMVSSFISESLNTRLGIPILYGVDAIHGHNNLKGAVIFPHNIALGATRNPELVERIAKITAIEANATGIQWNYAPVLAVVQDIRWGRTYESFGADPDLVADLASAYIRGLQGENGLNEESMMAATAKHFVGDGAVQWGSSQTASYQIDQGDAVLSEDELRAVHLAPYFDALGAGAEVVMVSFSSWNGEKLHGHSYLLNEVLKEEIGFEGFVVSDWGGIDQLDKNYYSSVVQAINAGIDMNMVPYSAPLFIANVELAVANGDISIERIDNAVSRILRVKFKLGLFENPMPAPFDGSIVGSADHRALAQEAVSQSAVLLQNKNDVLPIPIDSIVFVAGDFADDLGIQSGGWTIEWQGGRGNITEGSTILEGIQDIANEQVFYNRFGKFEQFEVQGDVGIIVIGETPYAEGFGDTENLSLSEIEIALIERVGMQVEKLVVVIVAGRPLMITEHLDMADSWVMAWLPGSEGQGVAANLFGLHPTQGKLPLPWPASIDQLPSNLVSASNLYDFGYGLEIP